MPVTENAGGLMFVPLPLPPPKLSDIAAYEGLLADSEAVGSAYLVPGLLPGLLEFATHFLTVGLETMDTAENLRREVGAQLERDDWRHERYPLMPFVEGDAFEKMTHYGIRLGRHVGRRRRKWEGFDGTIPDVPQPEAAWVIDAGHIEDLFEVDVPGGKVGDSTPTSVVKVPPGHLVRTLAPFPHALRSRLVYPMWTIDVGAEGNIERAVTLARELLAFDENAALTWVMHPSATRRWASQQDGAWLRRLHAFEDLRGRRGNIVIYDTDEDAHGVMEMAHDMGFPLVLPTPGSPYFAEVWRPSGWAAVCTARTLAA